MHLFLIAHYYLLGYIYTIRQNFRWASSCLKWMSCSIYHDLIYMSSSSLAVTSWTTRSSTNIPTWWGCWACMRLSWRSWSMCWEETSHRYERRPYTGIFSLARTSCFSCGQYSVECLSHALLSPGHETSSWKKNQWQSKERDKLFFDLVWLVPWITHMMVGNLKDNFSRKESHSLLSNNKVKTFFCELAQWTACIVLDNIHHQYRHGCQLGRFHSVFLGWGEKN